VHRFLRDLDADLLLALEEGDSPLRREWVATLWHRDSPVPDRETIPAGDPEAVKAHLRAMASPWRWLRPWAGLLLIDRPGDPPLVASLDGGGPAERAGLRTGDALLAAGGEEIALSGELSRLVDSAGAGDSIALRVRRAGEDLEVSLTPAGVLHVPEPRAKSGRHALMLARAETDLVSLEGGPERAAAVLGRASALMHGGGWEEAVRALRELETTGKDDPAGLVRGSAAFLEGLCLEKLGLRGDAATAYDRVAGLPGARLLAADGPVLAEVARLRAERLRALP
jgi:hypothetical protein